MAVDKKMNYKIQGGVKNYLGKQKQVKAPLKWQSSPDHPTTELAYITEAEKDLLVKQDLHGSLKGGVNRGPSGIMSLNGWGSSDPGQNVSGAAASAAESGRNTSDTLAAGMSNQDVQDFQAASVAAGAGQRVNPGFFDSRNTVSPDVLARAKTFAPQAFKSNRSNSVMDFITGGGIIGAGIRGLGQKLGLGKQYNQPTYDMSNDLNYNYDGEFEDDDEGTIYADDVLTGRINTGKNNIVDQLGRDNNNYQGITSTIPKIIQDLVNENSEVFKSRFLQNRSQAIRNAIEEKMQNYYS